MFPIRSLGSKLILSCKKKHLVVSVGSQLLWDLLMRPPSSSSTAAAVSILRCPAADTAAHLPGTSSLQPVPCQDATQVSPCEFLSRCGFHISFQAASSLTGESIQSILVDHHWLLPLPLESPALLSESIPPQQLILVRHDQTCMV